MTLGNAISPSGGCATVTEFFHERKGEKKGKATNMVACCTGGSTKRYKSGERRRAQFYHGADAIAVLAATTRLDALPEIRDSPVSAQINRASVRPDGLF